MKKFLLVICTITLFSTSKAQDKIEKFPIKTALQNIKDKNQPHWLVFDVETKKGIIQDLPTREDITIPIQEQLIVELYSR